MTLPRTEIMAGRLLPSANDACCWRLSPLSQANISLVLNVFHLESRFNRGKHQHTHAQSVSLTLSWACD